MQLAIDKHKQVTAKIARDLKTLTGNEVSVSPNERVVALSLHDRFGNKFYGLKKSKGLVLLPNHMFNNFNTFIGAL
tara:strand:- start:180 stop:407 length:228 start_codon:yes stop_codon:yes gene_type:complete